jgi:hypothetical protein
MQRYKDPRKRIWREKARTKRQLKTAIKLLLVIAILLWLFFMINTALKYIG